ncbi:MULTISPECIES: sugar phosphate isomerase/epimerase family protein [Psychrobacillus]|uniref:sugar phosphate isomerase/epimerase family protein n=1 Tax=Psychrobacillus TaxID=1221880 RepID=UPI0008E1174D|nr:sugar phosphate isomerase/epimerase family protein [Psychrobacillus psychrodurans]MCZ8539204.1 sugar phosphate isomerase/epimerase [Psychrobacillus psychrodurans]SFM33924.1 Sugar phosphate isomerase/epimerase [Psychrobacillus psychrodurans]
MNIYVSTSAIRNPFDLKEVLEKFNQLNITNIELGSSHQYIEDLECLLEKFKENKYVIHNYFPPLLEPIALNIASKNTEIRNTSINMAKNAIDLCVKLNAPIYSMHAGMLADPNEIKFFEGFAFTEEQFDEDKYNSAFLHLIASCKEINLYAKRCGVKFAIETSGGHPKKFKYLLMTKIMEFRKLITEVNDDNFGILLDIGHYNLATHLYEKEDINTFISEFKNNILQIHIHHNDGSDDQHLQPTMKELNYLKNINKETIIVLESMNNSPESILEQYNTIKTFLSKG